MQNPSRLLLFGTGDHDDDDGGDDLDGDDDDLDEDDCRSFISDG